MSPFPSRHSSAVSAVGYYIFQGDLSEDVDLDNVVLSEDGRLDVSEGEDLVYGEDVSELADDSDVDNSGVVSGLSLDEAERTVSDVRSSLRLVDRNHLVS